MDVDIRVNGVSLYNVSYHDGYIQADFPSVLCLTPADMTGVDIGTTAHAKQGFLAAPLGNGIYLRLMYPLPPRQECHQCHTRHYSDVLEYVSESVVEHYPTLADHRWYYVCKACIGMHVDEEESRLGGTVIHWP